MNRQEFIDQLREYLKVLQDVEQEDILAEYSQHIEMKMKNGLSEEEAIRDFGQVKELAAEILEAYHVSEALQRKSFLGAAASWLGAKAAFVGRGIRKACRFIWKQICRGFARSVLSVRLCWKEERWDLPEQPTVLEKRPVSVRTAS